SGGSDERWRDERWYHQDARVRPQTERRRDQSSGSLRPHPQEVIRSNRGRKEQPKEGRVGSLMRVVFMKRSFAVVAVVALGLAGNEAAKGSGGNASSNSAPAPHQGSELSADTTKAPVTRGFGG